HEDKPQVKELIRKTAFGQITNAIAPSPVEEPSESVRRVVCQLAPTEGMASEIAELKRQCEEKYAFAVAEHAKVTTALVEILRDAGTTWRFAALSSYFLDQLVSMTLPLDPEMASTLANNLTSDLVLFRESAMISLSSYISKLKHKCKEHCDDLSIVSRRQMLDLENNSSFGFAEYATLTKRAIDGDEAALNAPYIDNPSTGWYAWPKTAKAYVSPPITTTRAFDKIDPESLPAYQAIRNVIFAEGKWDSIAQWFSQESMQPDEDYFGVSKANLYMQLFSLFEEEVFEQAWPAIEKLALDTEKQSSQRAASEMVSGLLRG
ncbi:Proteasome activator BLM10, partial [Linderina macrospora]